MSNNKIRRWPTGTFASWAGIVRAVAHIAISHTPLRTELRGVCLYRNDRERSGIEICQVAKFADCVAGVDES